MLFRILDICILCRPVKLLVGTDEHGLKIQQAAAKASTEVLTFCNELSQVFKDLSKKANISYTTFSRTTGDNHKELVAQVWRTLLDKGYIYKGEYEGWYSITDECFYTSAQIVQSPTSTAENPEYVSKETGSKVEWSKEYNYMFRLSMFRDALVKHYSDRSVVQPSQYNSVVLQMLGATEDSSGVELADISISRPRSRLTWGIPVPNDPEHTVYVWFDALLIYLSGVGYQVSGPPAVTGWPPNLQVIGKDILRFHALYLPAILMALGAPSHAALKDLSATQILEKSVGLPKTLLTHAHWTVSQQKMSKSVGNVVDPMQSVDKYGLDIVRFYLARVGGRFRDDVDWSFEQLEKHSKELQSLLGNYLLRITSARITAAAAAGYEQQSEASPHALNLELAREVDALPRRVQELMNNLEVADALSSILDVLKLANKVITDIAPWSKTCSPALVYETRRTALDTLRVTGICLQPFVPETSERLLDALGLAPEDRTWRSILEPAGKGERDKWQSRDVKSIRLF
ncbi:methionine-tRNA synthetase [Coprinopsis cinerea okayama7|uniref:Probable methionine--tRNA ligase, mitochondrial n=1 Tax=Coprinopsis cinerea (strain Okayama-7 / 130 / ATCC MYA-4618 / FGSC 9003) TaxID=240176 RepID=A8P6P3_COPC7|nr:methionine-tRNA synthetase [Coprinopsis cinerea okayama7\|eukprot:XP_001839197.2 methionine-tRNA synthetase [Coprinopsis cinerea okayama7\